MMKLFLIFVLALCHLAYSKIRLLILPQWRSTVQVPSYTSPSILTELPVHRSWDLSYTLANVAFRICDDVDHAISNEVEMTLEYNDSLLKPRKTGFGSGLIFHAFDIIGGPVTLTIQAQLSPNVIRFMSNNSGKISFSTDCRSDCVDKTSAFCAN